MSEQKPRLVPPGDQPDEQAEPNPFDPERLRINLDFAEGVGVKKAIITIPVRKPNGQDYIRVHPNPAFRLTVALIELKDDRETYLVLPSIARDIPGEYYTATMYTAINRRASSSCGRCVCRAPTVASSRGTNRRQRRQRWR